MARYWVIIALLVAAASCVVHGADEKASLTNSLKEQIVDRIRDRQEKRKRTKSPIHYNQIIPVASGAENGCNVCPGNTTNQGSTVQVINNCAGTVTVYGNGFDPAGQPCTFGSGNPYQPNSPLCLQNIAPGQNRSITLISNTFGTTNFPNGWGYNFWLRSTGTYFEITPGPTTMPNQSSQDNFDISFNACPASTGCDIGMTLIAPQGSIVPMVVATPANNWTAPGAYPLGSQGCASQPCLSPTYSTAHGTFQLFLCNRPGDVNTPGPCGCSQCSEEACDPSVSPPPGMTCTSSGGAYCLSPCPSGDAVCNGTPTLTGQNGCVQSCPT